MSSEWKTGRLGDFIELKRGYDLPQAKRVMGTVPLVSSSGITDHHAEAMVRGPGVITGRYGTIGQVYFVVEDFWPLNTTLYVRDFKGNDPEFISYFLKTIDFYAYSDKAAVPGVNRNHVHEASARVPDLHTQRRIAGILGTLDNRIALLRETNATLEAIAQAPFKSWFVDFDPVRAKAEGREPEGLDADTSALFPDGFEESELGPVPRGWSVKPIGDVANCVGGGTPDTKESEYWSPAEFSWTTPKDLSGLAAPVLLETERKLSAKGLAKVSSGLLTAGTLLMSSRAPIGYLAIAEIPLAINQGYIAMLPDSQLPPVYLLFWCRHNMDVIKNRANGSTFMEISKKAFRPIPAVVPTAEILGAFVNLATTLFDRLVENTRQAQSLTDLRDTLLPRLISGQLRIPDAEAMLEDAA